MSSDRARRRLDVLSRQLTNVDQEEIRGIVDNLYVNMEEDINNFDALAELDQGGNTSLSDFRKYTKDELREVKDFYLLTADNIIQTTELMLDNERLIRRLPKGYLKQIQRSLTDHYNQVNDNAEWVFNSRIKRNYIFSELNRFRDFLRTGHVPEFENQSKTWGNLFKYVPPKSRM